MKHSILANLDDQDKVIKTNNEIEKYTYEFFKKLSGEDDFECEIVEDILKDEPYEHKKQKCPMLNPLFQMLQQLRPI